MLIFTEINLMKKIKLYKYNKENENLKNRISELSISKKSSDDEFFTMY